MPERFFVNEGGTSTWRTPLTALSVYDGSAWREVSKAFYYDGSTWRQHYQRVTLVSATATRQACTSEAAHTISWVYLGDETGWLVTVERDIAGAGYTTLSSTLDPFANNDYSAAYAGGDSENDYTFRVSLKRGTRHAVGSPMVLSPPLGC